MLEALELKTSHLITQNTAKKWLLGALQLQPSKSGLRRPPRLRSGPSNLVLKEELIKAKDESRDFMTWALRTLEEMMKGSSMDFKTYG
ncbi:unnamed protein product [Rhodiola kirilowii]